MSARHDAIFCHGADIFLRTAKSVPNSHDFSSDKKNDEKF